MAKAYGKPRSADSWDDATRYLKRYTLNDRVEYIWDATPRNHERITDASLVLKLDDALNDLIYLAGGSHKALKLLADKMNQHANNEIMRADEAEKREAEMVAELKELRAYKENAAKMRAIGGAI